MKAKYAQVIFRAKHADLGSVNAQLERTRFQLLEGMAIESAKASMKINVVVPACAALQHCAGTIVIVGMYAEIKIAVRAQASFGVEPRDRPTLDQDRFHIDGAEKPDHLAEVPFVPHRLQRVKTIGLL